MNIRLTAAALPQIDTTSLEELASTLRAAEEKKSAAKAPRPMPGPVAPPATDAAPREAATMPRILPPAVVESELAAPRVRIPEPAPETAPAPASEPAVDAAPAREEEPAPVEGAVEAEDEQTEETPAPPMLTLVSEGAAPAPHVQTPQVEALQVEEVQVEEVQPEVQDVDPDVLPDASALIEGSVAEVAAAVIAAMQASAEAHRRHLESIEQEAARRWEMLTAEAELDAELIRLNARREAHAIVAAARQRAGLDDDEVIDLTHEDEDPLSHISAMLSRFADLAEKQRGDQ